MLEKFADFIFFTRTHQRNEFEGLRDFLDYRTTDIAMEYASTVMFATQTGADSLQPHIVCGQVRQWPQPERKTNESTSFYKWISR